MHLVFLLPCLEHSGHSQLMQHIKLRVGTYTEEVPEWFNLSHASACSQLSNPFSAVIERPTLLPCILKSCGTCCALHHYTGSLCVAVCSA